MDPRVTEFQCIMPLDNIPSVLKYGILSYERATKLPHRSVAMQEVQDRRDIKQVPGGLKLHQDANLYFHARNPMLYKRKDEAVFADSNASSDYVRFLHPSQWKFLDFDAIYAMDWRHPGDPIAYYRHRSQKCAEVLVPHCIETGMLVGAYTVNKAAATRLASMAFGLPVAVDSVLFFR